MKHMRPSSFVVPGFVLATVLIGLLAQPGQLRLGTGVLLVGPAVMSLNLMVGQAGLVSLCHGALFGGAAYGGALLALHVTANPVLVILAGAATGGLLALVAGVVSLRMQGLYFLVLTLVAGQLLWEVVFHWREVTGGADGLRGFLHARGEEHAWSHPLPLYALAAGWALCSLLVLRHVVRRPAGLLMQALRDQPLRLRTLGYSLARIRLLTWCVSGVVAGGAGALYPFINHYVSPDSTHWSFSASLLIMGVIGGIRTLHGAWLGAAIYLLCQTWLSSLTEHWQLLVGLIFVGVVLFMPDGIATWRQRPAEKA